MTSETMNQQLLPSDAVVRKIQLLLNLGERSEGNETEAAANYDVINGASA